MENETDNEVATGVTLQRLRVSQRELQTGKLYFEFIYIYMHIIYIYIYISLSYITS